MERVKKALCLASMASNLDNFNRSNVKILQRMGYDVTLASNFYTTEDINAQEKIDRFIDEMKEDGVHIAQINFSRKMSNISAQIQSYNQVNNLLKDGFDIIHCHAPICAAITRLCANKYRKNGRSRVIYTAHGFHFYDGAPIKNWLLYYPVEKYFSSHTDVLITINREDYKRAKEKFRAKKIVYVPGIGVDTERFDVNDSRDDVRKELGLSETDIALLSVGELNANKNHAVVIKALAQMKEKGELPENLYYIIAGIGEKEEYLKQLIDNCNLGTRIKLVGYRSDVASLYSASDAFVFPSFREGLSVALMEAMASGLPVLCSRIRGNTDLIDEDKGGLFFDPADIESTRETIIKLLRLDYKSMGKFNTEKIKLFSKQAVSKQMRSVYESLENG